MNPTDETIFALSRRSKKMRCPPRVSLVMAATPATLAKAASSEKAAIAREKFFFRFSCLKWL